MTKVKLAYDIIGLLGSLILAAALLPQMVKVYRTKQAKDISRSFQLLYVLGLVMIVIYGLAGGLWPVYVPASLELGGGLVLLFMKQYYDSHTTAIDAQQDESCYIQKDSLE